MVNKMAHLASEVLFITGSGAVMDKIFMLKKALVP